MTHDSDYCRRRAAEARASACRKWDSEQVQIAGDLALAYSALAARRLVVRTEEKIAAQPEAEAALDG